MHWEREVLAQVTQIFAPADKVNIDQVWSLNKHCFNESSKHRIIRDLI